MATMNWLKAEVSKKAKDISELADEYWDAITGDMPGAEEALKRNPHTLGKFSVISTLGMMMYLPGMSEDFADLFARGADVDTGAKSHIKGKGYLPKVAQAISASSALIQQWEQGVEGAPKLGATETTDDLRRMIPLFQEQLSERAARKMKEQTPPELAEEDQQMSLLAGEMDVNTIN